MGGADPVRRADARRNRERVVAAAREVFAEYGYGVPLDRIAERAGVGPGTVYRHFASKQELFEAVVAARMDELVADARRRAADGDPGAGFFQFLDVVAAEAAAKRDVPQAIGTPGALREQLLDAVAALLARAQHAGVVRAEITAGDVLALMKGLVAAQADDEPDPARTQRLLAVLTAGLRPPG